MKTLKNHPFDFNIISTLGKEAAFTEELNVGIQVLVECKKETENYIL